MTRLKGCGCARWNQFPSISHSDRCPVSLYDGVVSQMNFIMHQHSFRIIPVMIYNPASVRME